MLRSLKKVFVNLPHLLIKNLKVGLRSVELFDNCSYSLHSFSETGWTSFILTLSRRLSLMSEFFPLQSTHLRSLTSNQLCSDSFRYSRLNLMISTFICIKLRRFLHEHIFAHRLSVYMRTSVALLNFNVVLFLLTFFFSPYLLSLQSFGC